MERRQSKGLFSSLRHSLSKNKQSASNTTPQPSQSQATYAAQPTRRPGKLSNLDITIFTRGPSDNPPAAPTNPFQSASSSDAPPAYTAAPNAAVQPVASSSSLSAPVADDAYAFLDTFDTIFVIDDSGSMAGSLWRQTADALMTVTPICTAHDADGIDIYFLNHPRTAFHRNITSASTVREIFQTVRPGGATPIGRTLNDIFSQYLAEYQERPQTTKPINIICITDGVPTDDLEGPLIQAAKKLDKLEAPAWQVGVQFFQVGSDPEATKHLKELDDDLADIANDRDMRDIVDTVPFLGASGTALSGTGILKVVLGAVTRRLDRKSKELHR